ncbi:MAG: hypothetical protein ABIJ47_10985 [Candidatus Bathyarchaeota archaeon]
MLDRWQLLHQDTKIRVLYSTLKTLLGFLAIVVASEYVSKAFAMGITGSWMIYYGEAISFFILGSITLREGARALMALEQLTKVFEAQAPQLLEAEPYA